MNSKIFFKHYFQKLYFSEEISLKCFHNFGIFTLTFLETSYRISFHKDCVYFGKIINFKTEKYFYFDKEVFTKEFYKVLDKERFAFFIKQQKLKHHEHLFFQKTPF